MTPNELKELATSQFQVLHIEDPKIDVLLGRTLGAWQDKAGWLKKITLGLEETETAIPDDFLSVAIAMDANGRYHEHKVDEDSINIIEYRQSVQPHTIYYFVNVRDLNRETGTIPPDAIGLMLDHLVALIAIDNTARARQIAVATGTQLEYPSDEELRTRKDNIELAMEDSQAIIPAATVY